MSEDGEKKFRSLIDDMVRLLCETCVGVDDRVGVLAQNSVQYIAFVIACWRVGAVVVPVSSRYPVDKINVSLASVGCDVLFVSNEYAGLELEVRKICFEHGSISEPAAIGGITLSELGLDLDNDADIIFTSGSTDVPKAVLHSLSNHYYSALGSDENIPFGQGDRWLLTLPMYHISGFSLIMRVLLHGGGIAIGALGDSLAGWVTGCEFSHISLVPTQLGQLMSNEACVEKLRSLKAILVGGGAIQSSLVERAVGCGLAIHTTYGSTEMCSQITTSRAGCGEIAKGSSGTALRYRKIRIGSDGEIGVKGEVLFKGYVEGSRVFWPVDEDGYFRTGDVGSVDADGNLFVVGRADNMFVSGGENIYPEQIERVISEIEGVEAVVVVGAKSEKFGERPVAFVKMIDGEMFDCEAIRAGVRERVEDFKVPDTFNLWPDGVSVFKPSRKYFRELAGRIG